MNTLLEKYEINIKNSFFVGCSLGVLFLVFFYYRQGRVVKNVQKMHSQHFIIFYKGILITEAEAISKSLENNYSRIRTELGDPEHDTIRVFIHATQKEFNTKTNLKNSTATGTSRGPLEFHLMYETWYNSFLPSDMNKIAVHEFTHCVQLNILIKDALLKVEEKSDANFNKEFEEKFSKEYPQWFWEAICEYCKQNKGFLGNEKQTDT